MRPAGCSEAKAQCVAFGTETSTREPWQWVPGTSDGRLPPSDAVKAVPAAGSEQGVSGVGGSTTPRAQKRETSGMRGDRQLYAKSCQGLCITPQDRTPSQTLPLQHAIHSRDNDREQQLQTSKRKHQTPSTHEAPFHIFMTAPARHIHIYT